MEENYSITISINGIDAVIKFGAFACAMYAKQTYHLLKSDPGNFIENAQYSSVATLLYCGYIDHCRSNEYHPLFEFEDFIAWVRRHELCDDGRSKIAEIAVLFMKANEQYQ